MSQRSIKDHFFLRKRPTDESSESTAKKRRLQHSRRLEDAKEAKSQGAKDTEPVNESAATDDGLRQVDSLEQQVSVPAYRRHRHLVNKQSVKSETQEKTSVSATVKHSIQGVPSWRQTTPVDNSDSKERQVLLAKSMSSHSKDDKQYTSNDDMELPAHEQHKHLVDSLELPHHYRILAEKFRCVDTIVSLMKKRKETCTFARLKGSVEQMCRRSFEKKNLGQMNTVYPTAYTFQQEKGLPYFHRDKEQKVEYQLTVDINVNVAESVQSLEANRTEDLAANHAIHKHNSKVLTSSLLIARRNVFHENLVETVKRHHQDFLKSLKVSIPVSQIKRWHPKFDLNTVPDIAASPLPEPPITRNCTTASDLLQDAKHKLTPKVVRALESVKKDVKRDEDRMTSRAEDRPCATGKPKEVHPELKGVCSQLLERIREKETQIIEEALTRDPAVEQKLAMMSRLPEVCHVLRSAFITEKKSSLLWDIVIKKLHDSCGTGMSTVSAGDHLKLLTEMVPTWISLVTIRHTKYVKLDRKADLSDILAKIKENKKAIMCGNSTVKDS